MVVVAEFGPPLLGFQRLRDSEIATDTLFDYYSGHVLLVDSVANKILECWQESV